MDNNTKEKKILDDMAKIFMKPWYKKPFRSFRNVLLNIKHVIKWIPIIWKDKEWDYSYFLDMAIFKLENMRDFYHGDDTMCQGARQRGDEIDRVVQLLKAFQEDNYETKIDPHFYDRIYSLINEGNNNWESFIGIYEDAEREQRHSVHIKADQLKQADLDKAFMLLAKNLQDWWD